MAHLIDTGRARRVAQHRRRTLPRTLTAMTLGAAAALTLTSLPAGAVDGCEILLCLAASSWRSITECVPPINQLLHDLARGKPFPICPMSSSGNSARHDWSSPPDYCPPQYMHVFDGETGPVYTCDYSGAVSVSINGEPFTRTWWSMDSGDTVTEFSATAKAQLGTWDSRFDDDYAIWLATLPPPTPDAP